MPAGNMERYSPSNPRRDWYTLKGSNATPHLTLDDFTRASSPSPSPSSPPSSSSQSRREGSTRTAESDSKHRTTRKSELRENATTASGPRAPLAVPTNSVRNFDRRTAVRDARSTRIVVHARFPQLVEAFLAHKRRHGSLAEKALYSSSRWTWQQQVTRLVEKRPLVFMGSDDYTLLRNQRELHGRTAVDEWDNVGRTNEYDEEQNRYLFIKDYLTYDEIMLSSLLGVSGPSYFINDGSRSNMARPGKPGSFEERGVIIGLVGARFERPGRMDSIFCLSRQGHRQRTPYPDEDGPPPHQDPRLTRIFRDWFTGGTTTSNSSNSSGSRDAGLGAGFYVDMYKARMRVTIDILLLEANDRAAAARTKAYVYVVGLGIGVWAYQGVAQAQYYMEAFADSLRELGPRLGSVATIDFAYINLEKGGGSRKGAESVADDVVAAAARAGEGGIKVKFTQRNPAEKLEGREATQLLVLSYAWDGNAFPGNEYWIQSLSGSGDPAAACMSTISELHNPLTNPGLLDRIKVLRSATDV